MCNRALQFGQTGHLRARDLVPLFLGLLAIALLFVGGTQPARASQPPFCRQTSANGWVSPCDRQQAYAECNADYQAHLAGIVAAGNPVIAPSRACTVSLTPWGRGSYTWYLQWGATPTRPAGYYNPIYGYDFYGCAAGATWDDGIKACVDFVPAKNLGQGTCPIDKKSGNNCGNPINVATGNKLQIEHDIASGELGFTRYYNSQSLASGALGPLWSHTYSHQLTYSPTASPNPTAVLSRPDGRQLEFRYQNSAWVADADIPGTLTQTSSGWMYAPQDSREVEEYDSRGRLTRISHADGTAIVLTYNNGLTENNDNDLRLTGVEAQDGRALVFEYDTSRRINKITDAAGAIYLYGYDSSGRLAWVTYPGTATPRTYAYGESAYTAGTNLATALTGITHEDAQRFATFAYATDGRAISTEHAGGVEKVSVQYGASTSTVTQPLGEVEQRAFATVLGMKKATAIVESCTGCTPRTDSYAFDANGYPDTATDARGTMTDYSYNSRGAPTQWVEAASDMTGNKRTVQTDWDASFAVPTERRTYNAAGALVGKQTWTYNSRGQVLTVSSLDPVSAAIRTTSTAYCEQANVTAGTCPLVGLVTAINGPRTDANDTTTVTYYLSDTATCAMSPTTCPHRKGDLWKVTDALGHVTETLAYDGAGRVLSVKDPAGVVTDFEYAPRGWLTARKVRGPNNASESDDQITRIDYTATGLVQKTTLPDGSYTAYTYDAAHRLTDITDGEGNTLHYTLDNAGNRIKEDTKDKATALVRTLSRVYDQLGQLQAHQDAYSHATTYTFDANGNADKTTDALGRVADNDYDPLNRLTRSIQDLGGINATTQFKYDAQDQLTEVVDPKGLSTKYTYNGLGDLTRLDSPDTGITTYTYDSAGNRISQTDARGIVTTYAYDALNRLIAIRYPTSKLNVAYTYDTMPAVCATDETFAIGRLSQITDGSGSTQYCYDRFGNLVRKVQKTKGKVFTVRYAYTPAGQLSRVTYPDGTEADYVRNAMGRTTEVGVTRPGKARAVLLTNASYHPFGPIAEWVFGNGRLFQRTLNQNYQPGVIVDATPGGLSVGYEFDAVGNLSKLRNGNQNDPPLRLYGYDALNRLTSAQDGTTQAFTEGYRYDATGNRTSATVGSVTTAYSYPNTSHHLTNVGGTARTYDNAGNTTRIGTRNFLYNDANRMSEVKLGTTSAMKYLYNGRGEQVRRAKGKVVVTIYDEAGHWLGEYNNNAAKPMQQVVWLDDLPVGLIVGDVATNQPLHYIEADALGTPRTIIEAQRNVAVWSWPLAGEAFGNTAPVEDVDGDSTKLVFNLRFPGQRYDAASGFNQNGFRDYEANGRYAESDPTGLAGGISTYGYVEAAPLDWIDPSGLGRIGVASNFSRGSGGNSAQRRSATREFLRQGNGDQPELDEAVRKANEAIRGKAKSLSWQDEYICLKVVCFDRKDPNQCRGGEGWNERTFAPNVYISLAEMYEYASYNNIQCRCERLRHISSMQLPEAGATDVLKLLARQRALQNYRNSRER